MKKQIAKSGAYFLVPSSASRKYVGRVVAHVDDLGAVLCQFLDIEHVESCKDVEAIRVEEAAILGERFVTKELLARGTWELCRNPVPTQELTSPQLSDIMEGRYVGATIFGAGLVSEFLDTFYGFKSLETWALPDYVAKFFSQESWSRRRPAKAV